MATRTPQKPAEGSDLVALAGKALMSKALKKKKKKKKSPLKKGIGGVFDLIEDIFD